MLQVMHTLKWKHLISNHASGLSDIFEDKSFSDVTLVSDDQIPFKAHRFVLSAFSPVFKNILLNNPHSRPLIFLRGVNHQELNSILQLIYLGEASIYNENIRRFAQVAKDLQIKHLADGIVIGPEPREDLDTNDDTSNQDIHTENEYAGRSYSSIADELINLDIPGSDELVSCKQQLKYKCEECEARYKSRKGL